MLYCIGLYGWVCWLCKWMAVELEIMFRRTYCNLRKWLSMPLFEWLCGIKGLCVLGLLWPNVFQYFLQYFKIGVCEGIERHPLCYINWTRSDKHFKCYVRNSLSFFEPNKNVKNSETFFYVESLMKLAAWYYVCMTTPVYTVHVCSVVVLSFSSGFNYW
jgi:hypothetical protein